MAIQVESGVVVGEYTVISLAVSTRPKRWLVRCSCGTEKTLGEKRLRAGQATSCGCIRQRVVRGRMTKHGQFKAPEYQAYRSAKHRCQNPNSQRFYLYGARGIEFRFSSFDEFINHIGTRPSPQHSLDRINNNGHYEGGNVRWATREQQQQNTRRSRSHA